MNKWIKVSVQKVNFPIHHHILPISVAAFHFQSQTHSFYPKTTQAEEKVLPSVLVLSYFSVAIMIFMIASVPN